MVYRNHWLPWLSTEAGYSRNLAVATAVGTIAFGGYVWWINTQQSPMLAKEKVPGALSAHVQGPPRDAKASHSAITDVTGEKAKQPIPPAL